MGFGTEFKQVGILTTENKRLREALSKILNSPHGEGIHLEGRIAQAALRGAKEFLAENKRLRNGYNDLIMTVERKCPGKSRYETAKRYINEREAIADCDSAKEALK